MGAELLFLCCFCVLSWAFIALQDGSNDCIGSFFSPRCALAQGGLIRSPGCLSVRLALPQGTCELPYQYRGHFSRPESLIGIFRQVTMIIRDKIVRFAQKFEKKFFATTFFRTKIYPSLSKIFFYHGQNL